MVVATDRYILKTLANSLAPFAASQSSFKILADDERISCDPAEILEAHDPGDSLPLGLLREAVQGIAHLGRPAQARLVLLTTATLDELPLHCASGLRRAGCLADMALQKLGAKKTGVSDTASSVPMELRQPDGQETTNIQTAFNDFLLDEISDDVSWFFSTDAENLDEKTVDSGPPLAKPELDVNAGNPAPPPRDSLGAISEELCRRCAATPLDKSGSGRGQQCFVYGRIRPVRQHIELRDGIICHVPHGYVAARGTMLAKLVDCTEHGKVLKTIFLDADLTSSAYESCAPAQRRLQEKLLQTTESPIVKGVPASRTARVQFPSEERDRLLAGNLRGLKNLGFEAIMLSGDFSEAVACACCNIGLVVAGGIPARLVHALAADCGAEVLHGLPDCGATFSHWEAKRALKLQLCDLSEVEHKRCFCYPVLGRRQSLLPEVSGPAIDGFWHVSAWADTAGQTTACTVLLEASCEPLLRQSFAQLSDSVSAHLGDVDQTDSPSDVSIQYELPCDWMLQVAESLEQVATSEAYPTLLEAEETAPLIAPWVSPLGDAAGDRAACAALAAGLRRVAAMEEDFTEADRTSFAAARAVLQRGSRLAQLLSRVLS